MLLKEFDSTEAIIEPSKTLEKWEGMPELCIGVYSILVFNEWVEKYKPEKLGELNSVCGTRDVYKMIIDGVEFAFYLPWIGGPLAAGDMDELIARGSKYFVLCGCCGVLRHDIADGHLIVPSAALRNEGTSQHYMADSVEVELDPELVKLVEEALDSLGLPYVSGKTWTTDAFFRETPKKIEKAKELGAVCVEMECATSAAVAKFRGVDFIQFLWSADNLDAPEWDRRGLSTKGESVSVKCMTAAIEIGRRVLERAKE